MLIINFAHPLTEGQLNKIEELIGQKVDRIINITVHFDTETAFGDQVKKLIKEVSLTPLEWQTLPILLIPPSLNYIAVTLQAALHGIMGYFAPIVRISPTKDNTFTQQFEVAEIINLQNIRDTYREKGRNGTLI